MVWIWNSIPPDLMRQPLQALISFQRRMRLGTPSETILAFKPTASKRPEMLLISDRPANPYVRVPWDRVHPSCSSTISTPSAILSGPSTGYGYPTGAYDGSMYAQHARAFPTLGLVFMFISVSVTLVSSFPSTDPQAHRRSISALSSLSCPGAGTDGIRHASYRLSNGPARRHFPPRLKHAYVLHASLRLNLLTG